VQNVIIICRYNEDLSWLKKFSIPFFIYNKGEDNIEFPFIKCENHGRESETYLRYIIDNYHDLPENLFLLQGDPLAHYPNFIETIFKHIESNSNQLVYLGRVVTESFYYTDILKKISEIYPEFELFCSSHYNNFYKFCQGAEYIVPKKYISSKPLKFWQDLYKIHNSYHQSPWDIERLWDLIFSWVPKNQ
jgi:hypothetical protein